MINLLDSFFDTLDCVALNKTLNCTLNSCNALLAKCNTLIHEKRTLKLLIGFNQIHYTTLN